MTETNIGACGCCGGTDCQFVALFNPWVLEGTAGVSTMTFTIDGVDLWSITVTNADSGDIQDIYQTVVVRTDPGIVSRSGFLDGSATGDLDLDIPWQSPGTYIDVAPSFFASAGTARVTLTTDGTTRGNAEVAIVRVVFDGTNWQYAAGPDKRLDLETFGTSDPAQSFLGGCVSTYRCVDGSCVLVPGDPDGYATAEDCAAACPPPCDGTTYTLSGLGVTLTGPAGGPWTGGGYTMGVGGSTYVLDDSAGGGVCSWSSAGGAAWDGTGCRSFVYLSGPSPPCGTAVEVCCA